MNKKLLILGLLSLTLMVVMLSCAPEDLGGTNLANQNPRIGVTNIEFNDLIFTFNAVLNWYGTDEDGQVMYFYYIVIPYDSVGDETAAVDYIDTEFDEIDLSEWTQTEETQATINMLASENETDTLHQYVFFMCEDNEGALSDIGFYILYRVNRLPQAHLDEFPGRGTKPVSPDSLVVYVLPNWSLPDTNALWEGLVFAWTGDDTLDFPDGAPDFQYKWEVYGPYDTAYYHFSDSTVHELTIDSISVDKLVYQSCASNADGYIRVDGSSEVCDEHWVWDTEVVLNDLRTGCYMFVVTTRDDALVADPTPAWGSFIVVEPTWIKDIMVVQSTQFVPTGSINGWPYVEVISSNDTLNFPDEIMDFYRGMIDSAGDYSYDIYGVPAIGYSTATDIPDLYALSKYKMLIIDDLDYTKMELKFSTSEFVKLLRGYLSVGGKIWVIGRQCFLDAGGSYSGYKNFDATSFAFECFDLSAAYYSETNNNGVFGEFIGAHSLESNFSFNYLPIDSIRTSYLSHYGINKVEALIRSSARSMALLTYQAANPDTMEQFQYLPVATKFNPEHNVFKTSYFSVPLYLMDNSEGQVQSIFNEMLNWFLNEDN